MIRKIIIVVLTLAAVGLLAPGCKSPRAYNTTMTGSEEINNDQAIRDDSPVTQPGTVLLLIGDIPDDIGKTQKTYRACAFWGNRGENFNLPIRPGVSRVQLENHIPLGAKVRIQFSVEDDPKDGTSFTPGDWRCILYGTTKTGAGKREEVRRVPLSCFMKRDIDWRKMRTIAPWRVP